MININVRNTGRGGREMTAAELDTYLSKEIRYGTISYIGEDGWPDTRPMNFGYYGGYFYFHAARKIGEKLKFISNNEKVCICLFTPSEEVGKEQFCVHKSVLAYGNIERIDGDPDRMNEAFLGMTEMCRSAGTAYKAMPERLTKTIHGIAIFRMKPSVMTGKMTVFTTLPSQPGEKINWDEYKK